MERAARSLARVTSNGVSKMATISRQKVKATVNNETLTRTGRPAAGMDQQDRDLGQGAENDDGQPLDANGLVVGDVNPAVARAAHLGGRRQEEDAGGAFQTVGVAHGRHDRLIGAVGLLARIRRGARIGIFLGRHRRIGLQQGGRSGTLLARASWKSARIASSSACTLCRAALSFCQTSFISSADIRPNRMATDVKYGPTRPSDFCSDGASGPRVEREQKSTPRRPVSPPEDDLPARGAKPAHQSPPNNSFTLAKKPSASGLVLPAFSNSSSSSFCLA